RVPTSTRSSADQSSRRAASAVRATSSTKKGRPSQQGSHAPMIMQHSPSCSKTSETGPPQPGHSNGGRTPSHRLASSVVVGAGGPPDVEASSEPVSVDVDDPVIDGPVVDPVSPSVSPSGGEQT